MVAVKNVLVVALAGFAIAGPRSTKTPSGNSTTPATKIPKVIDLCDNPIGRGLMRFRAVPKERTLAAKDRFVNCFKTRGANLPERMRPNCTEGIIGPETFIKCTMMFAKEVDVFAAEKGCPRPQKNETKSLAKRELPPLEVQAAADPRLVILTELYFCLKAIVVRPELTREQRNVNKLRCFKDIGVNIKNMKEEAKKKEKNKGELQGLAASEEGDLDMLVAQYVERIVLDSKDLDEIEDSVSEAYAEIHEQDTAVLDVTTLLL
ncbi:uncharacterized protein ColSpa_06853 [Colletotrichum spaethianum]|uniref:Secreted protein n=1 Tax=Colletotrichum spaethianum TaxID=700344 RepID=A0AA37NYW8_9PEZI|nr:uncharacterized protein ColSpa_06853 [Colletotrichum spaethianum]GKT46672.1 hypothetical protein ColSpa_06853 [Colletotrichum spaethianum]